MWRGSARAPRISVSCKLRKEVSGEATELRQKVAQGVRHGADGCRTEAAARRQNGPVPVRSVAPPGLGSRGRWFPMADAMGCSPPLLRSLANLPCKKLRCAPHAPSRKTRVALGFATALHVARVSANREGAVGGTRGRVRSPRQSSGSCRSRAATLPSKSCSGLSLAASRRASACRASTRASSRKRRAASCAPSCAWMRPIS